MATTTNYGWTTPDDTALVKDGAAAIRTLGSSVDTTTKALNPSTTLGDIEYRSSTANTNTRLGIGSTNQVLTVSGGVPAWVTPTAGAYTLLSTTSLSGSSVSVTGISQSYQDLFIEIYGATWTGSDATPTFGFNSAGTFRNKILYGTIVESDTTTLSLNDGSYNWLKTSANNYVSMSVTNYTTTDRYKNTQLQAGYTNTTSPDKSSVVFLSTYFNNNAVSSVQFAIGGNTFATGTIKIWGIK